MVLFISGTAIGQQVSDASGNTYGTVTIGTQVWLNAGLKTTRFSNGDSIPTTYPATLPVDTGPTSIYQWAYNGDDSLAAIYGRLYTWYAVMDVRNVCPVGWHVPSTAEFGILTSYLGGVEVAGGKLKEAGYSHWLSPNTGATNETGFNGVPNGNRNLGGYFNDMGMVSDNWSSTEGSQGAWDFDLNYNTAATTSYDDPKTFAFAVRCLRNLPAETDLSSVTVFPVPADDYLVVDCHDISDLTYEIAESTGAIVQTGSLKAGQNTLAIEKLPAGVYIIRLFQSQKTIEFKFIKA